MPSSRYAEEQTDALREYEYQARKKAMNARNRNSTGAFRTFYHFRRKLPSRSALKWIKQFIAEDRPQLSPNPLCMETRKHMENYYNKAEQGD